jgi:hypothetical protein
VFVHLRLYGCGLGELLSKYLQDVEKRQEQFYQDTLAQPGPPVSAEPNVAPPSSKNPSLALPSATQSEPNAAPPPSSSFSWKWTGVSLALAFLAASYFFRDRTEGHPPQVQTQGTPYFPTQNTPSTGNNAPDENKRTVNRRYYWNKERYFQGIGHTAHVLKRSWGELDLRKSCDGPECYKLISVHNNVTTEVPSIKEVNEAFGLNSNNADLWFRYGLVPYEKPYDLTQYEIMPLWVGFRNQVNRTLPVRKKYGYTWEDASKMMDRLRKNYSSYQVIQCHYAPAHSSDITYPSYYFWFEQSAEAISKKILPTFGIGFEAPVKACPLRYPGANPEFKP